MIFLVTSITVLYSFGLHYLWWYWSSCFSILQTFSIYVGCKASEALYTCIGLDQVLPLILSPTLFYRLSSWCYVCLPPTDCWRACVNLTDFVFVMSVFFVIPVIFLVWFLVYLVSIYLFLLFPIMHFINTCTLLLLLLLLMLWVDTVYDSL